MNILVLMAGNSEKFQQAGYAYPKNLIEISGKPVLEHFIQNIGSLDKNGNRFIFMINEQDDLRYHTSSVLKLLMPEAQFIKVVGQTAGAACTALLAIDFIQNDQSLLIVNGDIVGAFGLEEALTSFEERELDGGVLVFDGVHPRWSYVKCDENGLVVETAEKRPISRHATVGIYYFQQGVDYVTAAMEMIKKDAQVDNSFFVCPAYNEMILKQKRIGVFEIERDSYFSLATPQGLRIFEDYLKAKGSGRRVDDAYP